MSSTDDEIQQNERVEKKRLGSLVPITHQLNAELRARGKADQKQSGILKSSPINITPHVPDQQEIITKSKRLDSKGERTCDAPFLSSLNIDSEIVAFFNAAEEFLKLDISGDEEDVPAKNTMRNSTTEETRILNEVNTVTDLSQIKGSPLPRYLQENDVQERRMQTNDPYLIGRTLRRGTNADDVQKTRQEGNVTTDPTRDQDISCFNTWSHNQTIAKGAGYSSKNARLRYPRSRQGSRSKSNASMATMPTSDECPEKPPRTPQKPEESHQIPQESPDYLESSSENLNPGELATLRLKRELYLCPEESENDEMLDLDALNGQAFADEYEAEMAYRFPTLYKRLMQDDPEEIVANTRLLGDSNIRVVSPAHDKKGGRNISKPPSNQSRAKNNSTTPNRTATTKEDDFTKLWGSHSSLSGDEIDEPNKMRDRARECEAKNLLDLKRENKRTSSESRLKRCPGKTSIAVSGDDMITHEIDRLILDLSEREKKFQARKSQLARFDKYNHGVGPGLDSTTDDF